MEESGYYEVIDKFMNKYGYPSEEFGMYLSALDITPQELFDIFYSKLGEEKFDTFLSSLLSNPIHIDLSGIFYQGSFMDILIESYEVVPSDKTVYLDKIKVLKSLVTHPDGSSMDIHQAHIDADDSGQASEFENSVDRAVGEFLENYFGFPMEPTV